MVMITDRQFDIALRYALQNCFEEEIEEMDKADPVDYPANSKTEKRFKHALKKALWKEMWSFSIPRPLKKVAIIVLIIATVLFTTMMATPSVRASVWNVIVKWYDNYIGIWFNQEDDTPATIREVVLPSELPNGWRIETITSTIMMVEHVVTTNNNDLLFFSQYVVGAEELWLDNTNVEVKDVMLTKGMDGQLYLYEDSAVLVWKDQYVFVIKGENDSIDLFTVLANNIVERTVKLKR